MPQKKQKKRVTFNLDHEEIILESKPDRRRTLALLKHKRDDCQDIEHGAALYEAREGSESSVPASQAQEKRCDVEDEEPRISSDPETKEDSKDDIGFTIYRDGY